MASSTVVARRISHGRSTSYHLTVSPFGVHGPDREIEVSRDTFSAFPPGQPICLGFHPGRFGLAWYEVRETSDC